MSEQTPQPPDQKLNISGGELEEVQIGGIAGRDVNVTQVQGQVIHLTVYDRIPNQFQQLKSNTIQPLTQYEYRQRKALVDKVKEYWIKGVLETSLHTKALIELGLEERPDTIQQPFSDAHEFSDRPSKPLPPGADVMTVFHQIGEGRTLLILGEPGSGKTITLLKLAQNLLARNEEDVSQLIPAPFNLSSWTRKRQPITTWLVQELYEKYPVSTALAKELIKREQLILLLDGLDEVEQRHRNACVEAINHFTQTHNLTELVVCCRIQDYEQLFQQLKLRFAVCVQPLTDQQIHQFLDRAGERLIAVKNLLNANTNIRELARSPLMLSVMALAYQDTDIEALPDATSDACTQILFDAYINRMLKRKVRSQKIYPQHLVQQRLIWLAKRMKQTAQTIFLIEDLQPDWLTYRYGVLAYRIFCGVTAFCLGILALAVYGLWIGIFLGIIGPGGDSETFLWFSLLSGYELLASVKVEIVLLLALWISMASIGPAEIKTVETLKWRWQALKKHFISKVLIGLIGGWFLGVFWFNSGWIGFLEGLIFVIIFCGLESSEFQGKNLPNQGIRKSYTNILVLGLFTGLTTTLSGILATQLAGLSIVSFLLWPYLGLIVGAATGFIFGGGKACLQHFTLRLMLYRLQHIPWNYARFLDYAASRLFLQKVGGGYIFVHRILLEHFAAMKL